MHCRKQGRAGTTLAAIGPRAERVAVLALLVAVGLMPHARPRAETPGATDTLAQERPFVAENETAMARMMSAMAIAPTGDVDRDFVAMMVPHHQGAVDMAVAELRYSRNEQLKRIAQEIIVTQMDEIRAMGLAIGASPAGPPSHEPMAMPGDTTTKR